MAKKNDRRIAKLLREHLKLAEKARIIFRRSAEKLDMALSLKPAVDQPIDLHDRNQPGKQVVIRDAFAVGNTAFGSKSFSRYKVDEVKHWAPKSKSEKPQNSVPKESGVAA